MKILILTDRMDRGGAETHIYQLALGLARLGEEVTVLSGGGDTADALEQKGIRQLRVPINIRCPLAFLRLRRYLCRLVKEERFDILHAHARIPALLIRGCERWGCRSVVTVHARFRSNILLSKLCHWGRRTVAVSEDLRAYVCDVYRVPAERVTVIPNGIDCRRFAPATADRTGDSLHVLFASRLDGDCSLGAELLCEIAPSLCRAYPTLQIAIAGGGDRYSFLCERVGRVNRLLGREAVSMLGWVGDMSEVLRGQDVFVGVSRAAMEAAAGGCAVILCGNEGYVGILDADSAADAKLSNFCGRGHGAASAEQLERDLRLLLESPALRKRCAEEGRELIVSSFSAEQMCRQTQALYRRDLPEKKRLRLTVGGYFGCGNVGDDAILLGLLEAMREIAPTVALTALTGRPCRDRRRFGISCVHRRNPIAVRFAMLCSRAFLCGGGSLLQNLTSNRSLSYYLGLLRASRHMGCATVLFSAGVGPLIGLRAGKRVKRTLSRCDYISLRDADSLRYLSVMGVGAELLHLGADPALLMPMPPEGRAEALLFFHGVPRENAFFGVVLRGGGACRLRRETLLAAVRMICTRNALTPIFPILDEEEDGWETREAAARLGGHVITLREPSDATAILSVCASVVTMRLHALILSTAVTVPAVGISADARDGKIAAFAKAAGQEYINAERLTVGQIVERVEECLQQRRSRAPILADAVSEMRKKTRKDIANMTEMIYNMDKKP